MNAKKAVATLAAAGALTVAGGVAPASAAPPVIAAGNLVNVQVTDVIDDVTVTVQDINVTVAAAANIIAQVCGTQIPVAVLATQVVATDGTFACDATVGDQAVTVNNA
jgi:hypothetical protein